MGNNKQRIMRIVFFGMTGQFSLAPLEALLTAEIEVCAVVVPAVTPPPSDSTPRRVEPPQPGAPELNIIDPYLEHNIIHRAWAHDVPVWEVDSLSEPQTLSMLAKLNPDLIVVACFPHIFPPKLWQMPLYGCLNLHPSLLPAYRGPAPLFWIARNNEQVTGVTLHFLDEGVDSGDIVFQTSFDRPDGMSGASLDQRCAEEGSALLLTAIRELDQGALPRRSQGEAKASYFPWPDEADFIIPTEWPAQRAFNFLRGAEDWPLIIDVGDATYNIRQAISYAADQTLNQPYIVLGDELWVQFQPGVLRAKLAYS